MSGQRHSPASLYTRERRGTHCTGIWVGTRAGLDRCGKFLPPTEIRSPDRPARSQSLYRLRYPAHIPHGPSLIFAVGKPATNSLNSDTAFGANSFCLVSSWNARHFVLNVCRKQSAGSESPKLALIRSGSNFLLLTHDFPQTKNACCVLVSVLVMLHQAHKLAQFVRCTTDGSNWSNFYCTLKIPRDIIRNGDAALAGTLTTSAL